MLNAAPASPAVRHLSLSRPIHTGLAGRAGQALFRALSVVAVVAMLFGNLVALPETALAATGTTTANLNMRSGPSTNYAVILVIPRGASVTIDGDPRSGFYPVSYGGRSGYASASYISLGGTSSSGTSGTTGSPSATGTATVTSSLNLRAGPSTGDRILLVMPAGASVTLNGRQSNGFLSVTYRSTSGWAYAQYLSQGGTAAPAPDTSSGSVPVGDNVVGTRTVTTGLNLRRGPSTSYGVILVMRAGSTVEVMGSASGGFLPVRYQGSTKGWASATYLSIGGGSTDGGSNTGSTDVISIIYAAADRYGQPREDMLRVARCESNLIPTARNASSGASGLFQFLPSTWETTPYRDYNIFDAWASANAAGWMWANGRRNEWSCQ
ncbi:MAG: SH3 domain-containing protein [Chloroflexota bacterium]|nr:SH3 domain-containing protein [Chloroflexota bacterium]